MSFLGKLLALNQKVYTLKCAQSVPHNRRMLGYTIPGMRESSTYGKTLTEKPDAPAAFQSSPVDIHRPFGGVVLVGLKQIPNLGQFDFGVGFAAKKIASISPGCHSTSLQEGSVGRSGD